MVEHAKVKGAMLLAVRAALALVFAWAGLAKIVDPAAFQVAIERYHLVPALVAHLMAAYLPWLELVAGAGLWVRPVQRGAEVLLLGLTAIFLVAIISAAVRGLNIECGCFGLGKEVGDAYAVLIGRDLVIAAGLVALLRHKR